MKQSGSMQRAPRTRLRLLCVLVGASFAFAGNALAIDVANQTDWNTAVAAVAAAGAGSTTTINFTGGFTLTSSMAALSATNANVTVNITGNNNTVNGNAAFQGITVMGTNAPTVNISNLTLNNTLAKGGNGGGGGDGGGGGGLGAGGGLFVASGANVTLQDVAFTNNKAQGGNGGTAGANSGGAGGGGLNGGTGGTPPSGSGTGGAGGVGGSGPNFSGSGGTAGTAGGVNVANGGVGGAGTTGGGGGAGGAATGTHGGGAGGAGGFGGGGGGGGIGGTGGNGAGGAAGYGGGPGGNGNNGPGTGGTGYGGAVFVMNGATLTIKSSGNLSYSGNTTAKGTGVAGSITANQGQDIFINGAGQTVTFQVDSGTSTFSGSTQTTEGNISGEGGLTKTGAGNLVLTGTNKYTGTTNINAGTLSVNGSIASPVSVNSGGTLGGTGTISNSVAIQNGGTFAPGNSIGTITVNGSLVFNAGSVYRVEVDAAGNADRINVTGAPGTATINGGTVSVQAGTGTYQDSTRYTILNATGGVTGAFSSVTSNFAFLTPSLAYDANNVFLTLARNQTTFTSVATTPNQYATAGVFQNSAAGASGDMSTVLTALTGLSAEQARYAFDTTGGATIVEMRRAGIAFANGFSDQMSRRVGIGAMGDVSAQIAAFNTPLRLAANEVFSDVAPLYAQSAASAPVAGARGPRDGRGFWIVGYGDTQKTNSDGNAYANKLRGGGVSGGIDVELGSDSVVGVAISSGTSRITFDGLGDSGRSRGNAFGLYGIHVAGPWSFKGVAGLSENNNHMDRNVVVGTLARTASSDFRSRNYSLYLEAAYDLKQATFTLQPVAALSYLGTRTNNFTETGAGALSLDVAAQNTDSTRSLFGARTIHEFEKFKLKLQALWAHEFGNTNTPITASFSGAPAAGTFQVNGVKLKRDSLVLGLDASGEIRKDLSLILSAQAEGRSGQLGFAVFGGVRKRF